MFSVGKRCDTVINETEGAAPDNNIAALQSNPPGSVAAAVAAEQEDRRQSERDRHDRRGEIALILVAMQRQPRPGFIAIDQARVRLEPGVTGSSGRARGEAPKRSGH